MQLSFLGAAREVTGSCTLLTVNDKHILVDCGMEQGADTYENQPMPIAAGEVDAVLVTHAHIDHTGRIPLLVKQGYKGPIYATNATTRLCDVMLRDSAHIQEFEAEWQNRKGKRKGQPLVEPLYDMMDAQTALTQFVPCAYNRTIDILDGVRIRFVDVGHLLGSSSIEVWVTENGTTTKLIFSGDIGNDGQPMLRDPVPMEGADYVIMESTYGDRKHAAHRPDYVKELAGILQETFDQGGNVVIPSFAVGRTQELLYFIREIKQEGLVKGHDGFPVYVDSPLAIEATRIFTSGVTECFDEEAMVLVRDGVNPITFPNLKLSVTADDSKQINADKAPKVIISASGMCEAGRIRHHLKHNLWRKESTVLFVGYQANGSLGRILLDGAVRVKLFGEEIEVDARIRQLTGLSGHADRSGLLDWLQVMPKKPARVFVNHGDDEVAALFARDLNEMGYQAVAPYNGEVWQLQGTESTCVEEGNMHKLEKRRSSNTRSNTVYQRLLAAGQRLLAVITSNEGGANKDLARFADQINALADKWER